jgi:hypothetical protein
MFLQKLIKNKGLKIGLGILFILAILVITFFRIDNKLFGIIEGEGHGKNG